jgi:hypothetical protein
MSPSTGAGFAFFFGFVVAKMQRSSRRRDRWWPVA